MIKIRVRYPWVAVFAVVAAIVFVVVLHYLSPGSGVFPTRSPTNESGSFVDFAWDIVDKLIQWVR